MLESGYPVPLSVLSVYRILFATYLLVLNTVPDLRWIAGYPSVFYDPAPGMPALWGGFPPYLVLAGLELLLIAAICALLVGWRTPTVSIAVTVIGYTANSAYFTFGKIDHTFMTWIVPALLAYSGWGRLYSFDAARNGPADDDEVAPAWPVFVVGSFLALSFLSAALPKILRGWLSFETSAVRRNFLQFSSQLDRNHLLAKWFVDFEFPPFWEALDWAGVGLETALAFALLWPLAQRWLILAVWLFHVANLLLLNISFYGPLPVYPLFFLPLLSPALGRRFGEWVMTHRRPLLAAVPVLAALAFFGRGLWWTVTRDVIGLPGRWSHLTFFLTGLAVLVVVTIRTRGYRRVIGT
jgi:hypothetical protein